MPNALTFIIGADSQPFAKEMRQMEKIASASAMRISSGMAQAAEHSYAGIVRESLVIGREAVMGRGIARISASSTLLAQFLSALWSGVGKAGQAARAAANAYELMAFRQQRAADASAKVAEALVAEVDANQGASISEIQSAIAATEQTAAQNASALAFRNKAAAARAAAEAEAIEASVAKSGVGFLSVTTRSMWIASAATIAVSIGLIYEYFRGIDSTIKSLDYSLGNVTTEYVPLLKRHLSDALNLQRQIAEAVQNTTEKYDSAAEAAKRQTEISKMQFEHERKMLDIKKESKLLSTKNPQDRIEVENQYIGDYLGLDSREHQNTLAGRKREQEALNTDIESAKRELAQIGPINTADEDAALLKSADERKKQAEEVLGKEQTMRENARITASRIGAYATGKGTAYDKRLEDAKAAAAEKEQSVVDEANKLQDTIQQNDLIRKRQEELRKRISESSARIAEIGVSDAETREKFAIEEQNKKDEMSAKAQLELTKKDKSGRESSTELSALQRIGGEYAFPAMDEANNIARDSNRQLHQIRQSLHQAGTRKPPMGSARF